MHNLRTSAILVNLMVSFVTDPSSPDYEDSEDNAEGQNAGEEDCDYEILCKSL